MPTTFPKAMGHTNVLKCAQLVVRERTATNRSALAPADCGAQPDAVLDSRASACVPSMWAPQHVNETDAQADHCAEHHRQCAEAQKRDDQQRPLHRRQLLSRAGSFCCA
jgi:hypothetical protein